MSDDTASSPGFDRRRFIKGAGAGVALAWTAPIITGMNARAFAAGSDPDCRSGLVDDFDDESPQTPSNPDGYSPVTDLTHFTVSGGTVDIIGYAGTPYVFFGGTEGLYIDLDGTTPPDSSHVTLTSKQKFCEGTYNVAIRYAGSQRDSGNSFVAALGAGGGSTGPVGAGDPPTSLNFTAIVAPGGGNLTIVHNSGSDDNQGIILLEVSVTP